MTVSPEPRFRSPETRFRSPVRAAVVTVSDRCAAGTQVDLSGPALVRVLAGSGIAVEVEVTVADELEEIAVTLRRLAETAELIVTTGGTGLAPRDVTPEATRLVCDRMVDGMSERMRAAGLEQTAMAPLSRGVCGCRGTTLIVNVPGSPAGAESSLRAVLHLLPHALDVLAGRTQHAAGSGEGAA